jgi:autotransporter translocation and assembly factor TamB
MKKLWCILKWFAAGVGVLFLLAIVTVAVYTRTENFTRWLREEAIAVVNQTIRGTLSVERLDGSVWSRLTLYNVILRQGESEIAKIPRLEVFFSLIPLIWGELKISGIDATEPRANLLQDPSGQWNLVEALSPRQPEPEKQSGFIVLVESLHLRNAGIDMRMASGGKLYRLQDLNLQGRVGVRPSGVVLDVAELMTVLVASGQPDLRLKGALGYEQAAGSPATVEVKNFWAVSRNSQVKLNGQFATGEKVTVKAQASIAKLAAADVAYFVSQWPLKPDITGNLAIEGPLDALNGNLELAGAGGKIAAKFKADVAQANPRYSATATVNGFDLRQWLGRKDVAGVMQGTLEANGNGFALRETQAKVGLEVRGAQVQEWLLGTLSMQGGLKDNVATLDGRLKSKLGGAEWSGKVALSEKRPPYELALSVKDLDIEKVANGTATQGKLNLQGKVKGAGFTLVDMNTRAEVRILPSSIGPVAVKEGALNATLNKNKIQIVRAALATDDATLNVNGELGLDAKNVGNLDYRLRMTDVSPWLALVKSKGSGAIELSGQARGNLADLQTQGMARLSGLDFEGTVVKAGNISFALQGSQEEFFPRGVVTAQLTDIAAGLNLRRLNATAKLSRQAAPSIQLDIDAQDMLERKHAVSGTVDLAPDALMLRLSQISLTAPDGAWKLSRPATVTKRDDAFIIDQLSMKNGDRELALYGRFAVAGNQELTLTVDRLPLGLVTAFLAQPPKVTGLLAVHARVTGSAAAPEIAASAKLTEATLAGQAYAGATADLGYQDKRATLRLAVRQDAAHALNANGTLPLNLSWSNGFRADFADGLDLRIQSAGLSVAFLNAFSGKSLENIAGEVSLDASARGAVKQPELRGTFQLRDGRVKVVPLGVDINGITVTGGLDSRSVNVRELTAKAKDGEIKGSGSLALKDFDANGFKLALTAQRWPAIETQRYQVKVAGDLEAQGTLTAPKITGKVTVLEGSLRPDIGFLEQNKAALKPDETIVFVNKDGARRPPPAQKKESANSSDDQLFKNLSLDLAVVAPGNLWIRHPDLVAELSSNVHATKMANRDIDLTGRVDVVRGWLAFQGRRFQLTKGAIEFTGGGKINPSLDIVAQYRLPNYEVDATIGGTVEKPTLTLASDPRLEQADVLALLIFGKPIASLSQKEQGSLQQSALSITSGYVASQIANSVSNALGLDSLGVDLREVDFSGGRIGFGRYVGNKTYVSVSQELANDHGREVGVEYEVAPNWKIGSTTSSSGSKGIDIIWNKRY